MQQDKPAPEVAQPDHAVVFIFQRKIGRLLSDADDAGWIRMRDLLVDKESRRRPYRQKEDDRFWHAFPKPVIPLRCRECGIFFGLKRTCGCKLVRTRSG